jgi:hypothetical protein
VLALGCIVLAAVSLLVFDEPTYDPTAWLIWGREIVSGSLDTVAGPSWKPLPVIFTTPFSLFSDDAAINLWLVVARAGGIASLVLAYRVAHRFFGHVAGAVAALGLLLANEFLFNWLRGNSEGLLVALALMAFLRYLDGRQMQAFAWGVAAALLRPEVWAILGLYGLWLMRERRDKRTAGIVLGSGAAIAVLWFVPEYIGSGDLLRSASRAREPVPNSPGSSEHPFLETFTNSAKALTYAAYAGAVAALVPAWRDRRILALAAASSLLMVIVAFLAKSGFTGNIRYVALPMALLAVLAGVGWGWVASVVPAKAVLAVLALAALPGLIGAGQTLQRNLDRMGELDKTYGELPRVIATAGGRDGVLRCGQVYTGPFQTQILAYRLHLHQKQVGIRPRVPGAILDVNGTRLGGTPGFERVRLRTNRWVLRTSC